MSLEPWQWIIGAGAALLVGISKTGVPGIGMLVVPMLAGAFGGRPSIGIMLPMLIMGDCFAVAWYRRHAQWDRLIGLLPWVVVGLGIGAGALWAFGEAKTQKDILSVVIGALVLVMLGLYLLQRVFGERLAPRSAAGMISTGISAGFATTVSNAAGPIMSIYLAAQKLPKEQFMGTIAWYFFIINIAKLPIYFALTAINPAKPIVTGHSLLFNLAVFPAIVLGVFLGRWVMRRMSQQAFDTAVLALAALGAIKLLVG
jgi:uncharacterized membrane protein YfcA